MRMQRYKIVGHKLCPYVQRVVIVMLEKNIAYDRVDIDLDDKPAWLDGISPDCQVPVFQVRPDDWLFESGVTAQYLDRTWGGGLLPTDPLECARHQAWMAYADGMLNIVARIIYRDADAAAAERSMTEIAERLRIVDARFPPRPYFAGVEFGLVDVVFATLFRYFPVFDQVSPPKLTPGLGAELTDWWERVRCRPSVSAAVPRDYEAELTQFIAAKNISLASDV